MFLSFFSHFETFMFFIMVCSYQKKQRCNNNNKRRIGMKKDIPYVCKRHNKLKKLYIYIFLEKNPSWKIFRKNHISCKERKKRKCTIGDEILRLMRKFKKIVFLKLTWPRVIKALSLGSKGPKSYRPTVAIKIVNHCWFQRSLWRCLARKAGPLIDNGISFQLNMLSWVNIHKIN